MIPFGMFSKAGRGGGTTIADIITRLSGKTYAIYDFRPGSNSIFSDTAATVPITGAGGSVAAVKDLGNMARNITQSTAGNRPTSAANGSTFDGSNDVLSSSSASFGVGTVVIAANVAAASVDYTGVVTNQSDQTTNIDLAFGISPGSTWDAFQAAGSSLGSSSRFWNNKVQTAAVTRDSMRCYSTDGTGHPGALNFPNGLRVGADRGSSTRNLTGTIGLIVIVTTILPDADRIYIEDTIMNMFSIS